MGYKIKEVRDNLNMSQEELAEKSGVSRTTISQLENDDARVTTTSTLVKLAEAMGITVDQLFYTNGV